MLITASLITYLFDHIAALESIANRQAEMLMQYADEHDRLHMRIEELVSQANSEYAPYREMVQTARDEVNRFSADNECLRDAMLVAQRDERIAQAEIVSLKAQLLQRDAVWLPAKDAEIETLLSTISDNEAYFMEQKNAYAILYANAQMERKERERLQAALIEARLNCQEIRV